LTEESKADSGKKKEGNLVSRRQFIGGTVGGLVVGAVAGVAAGSLGFPQTVTQTTTATEQPWLPASWDQEADVVVIGYGGAGAVTAITAHDAGADVLILEKTPSLSSLGVVGQNISGGGGNTHINGGLVVVPSSVSDGATHAYYLCWGTTPMAVCQAWAQLANQIPAYLDKLGVKYATAQNTAEMPNLPGASSITTATVNGGGASLFHALDQAIQSRNIKVMFSTAARSLIQDPTTLEVLGVKVAVYPAPSSSTSIWTEPTSGTTMSIKANKAVVLCTGGFEYDDAMKANFLKMYPVHFYGWQYNSGDGVRMASDAGADLWHLNMFSGRCVPWFPDHDMAYGYVISAAGTPMILTDKYGKRYADESSTAAGHNWWVLLDDFNIKVPEYSRIPTFMIFDEARRKAGPISSYGGVALPPELGGLTWSSDNSAEIAKGYIQMGNTPGELAAAINQTKYVGWNGDDSIQVPSGINVNIDPNVLTETITNYNSYCTAGNDQDFARNPKTLLPFQSPPFYALPLWPGGPNSQGGPRRNEKGQVLDTTGNPIPRLYSAGELGSIWGLYPTGGGNNSELLVFGQISGTNAAAETAQS
jgi:succinate dehydrogenase/fumarate reductase flavoprotein subunit